MPGGAWDNRNARVESLKKNAIEVLRLGWSRWPGLMTGPGKLLPFGVRKNPKIRPQIHMVGGLKSAHSDKGHHVSSKKGNTYFDFFFFCSVHSSRFLRKREAGIAEI